MMQYLPVLLVMICVFSIISGLATSGRKNRGKLDHASLVLQKQPNHQLMQQQSNLQQAQMQFRQERTTKKEGSQRPLSREHRKKDTSVPTAAFLNSLEDRQHDWLARQLAEERESERRFSAMYGLRMEHAANCEAAKIRRDHRIRCDADGVDRGVARRRGEH